MDHTELRRTGKFLLFSCSAGLIELGSFALEGLISKESPVGKAVMGHRAGETVHVQVNENVGYDIVIRSVEKGQDDDSLPISAY